VIKKTASIFMIFLIINIAFAQAQSTTDASTGAAELQFNNDGVATLYEPAKLSGVLIKPSSGTPTLKKTSDGYELKGEINVPDLHVQISNANQLEIMKNSVSGVAASDTIVNYEKLTPGTRFRYDKEDGTITIEKGGSVYLDNPDGRVFINAKEGKLRILGDESGVYKSNEGSTIEVKQTDIRTGSPSADYRITTLSDGTKISGLDRSNGRVKVEGDAVLIPTLLESSLFKATKIEPLKESVELHGTTEFVVNPQTNKLESLYFNRDGQSYYRASQQTDFGTVSVAYTNAEEKEDGTFLPAKSAIFFRDPSPTEAQGLDGYAAIKHVGTADKISAKGIVSISARTPDGEFFSYSGTDPRTNANILIKDGFWAGKIDNPSLIEPRANSDLAIVNYGNMKSVYVVRDGELKQLVPTRTVFTKNPGSMTDIAVGPDISVPTSTLQNPVGPISYDTEAGGIFGTYSKPTGEPSGVGIVYPQIELASEKELRDEAYDLDVQIEKAESSKDYWINIFKITGAIIGAGSLFSGGVIVGPLIGSGVFGAGSILSEAYFNGQSSEAKKKEIDQRLERTITQRIEFNELSKSK